MAGQNWWLVARILVAGHQHILDWVAFFHTDTICQEVAKFSSLSYSLIKTAERFISALFVFILFLIANKRVTKLPRSFVHPVGHLAIADQSALQTARQQNTLKFSLFFAGADTTPRPAGACGVLLHSGGFYTSM